MTKIELFIIGSIIILITGIPLIKISAGVYPFGPEKNIREATVERLYVDRSSESSHYMIGTDKGVFECDNSVILQIFNADEIYSSLQEGQTYNLTVKGNKFVNFFAQNYPHITKVEKIP